MAEILFDVEVAYAKPEQQVIVSLKVPVGTTAKQAIDASGLLKRFPEIDETDIKTGIFGNTCKLEQSLKQGDRVEIYRPLVHDPKEARRQRAESGLMDADASPERQIPARKHRGSLIGQPRLSSLARATFCCAGLPSASASWNSSRAPSLSPISA